MPEPKVIWTKEQLDVFREQTQEAQALFRTKSDRGSSTYTHAVYGGSAYFRTYDLLVEFRPWLVEGCLEEPGGSPWIIRHVDDFGVTHNREYRFATWDEAFQCFRIMATRLAYVTVAQISRHHATKLLEEFTKAGYPTMQDGQGKTLIREFNNPNQYITNFELPYGNETGKEVHIDVGKLGHAVNGWKEKYKDYLEAHEYRQEESPQNQ